MQKRCLWCAPKLWGYRQAKRQAGKQAGRQDRANWAGEAPIAGEAYVDRALLGGGQRDKAGRQGI